MGRIRLYVAMSLDGFIADRDGTVGWLADFDARRYGYDAFIQDVGALVFGRRTYDQVAGFGAWPYAGKATLVATSRPLEGAPDGVSPAPSVADAIERARTASAGDVWVVGGAEVMGAALDLGLVSEAEVFVMPRVLGGGIGLFANVARVHALNLVEQTRYEDGVVRLHYAVSPAAATLVQAA